MITNEEIAAWFSGRLPGAWTESTAPTITIDREEITVIINVEAPATADDATDEVRAEAAAGRISAWREDTRESRIAIASEAQRRFERKVSWGAAIGDTRALFTHVSLPVMTRLRQPQRQVLDTLVEAGVARSRADALAVVRPPGRPAHRGLAGRVAFSDGERRRRTRPRPHRLSCRVRSFHHGM